MDFHFHEPWNLEKGPRDDSVNGLDIKKCKLKLIENCFMSPEFDIKKVQFGNGQWHNMLRLNVKVARKTGFYTMRVQSILTLITFSGIASNFASESLDGQLGYLSACLLAAVAYLYVLSDALPKLEYLTLMDQYIYACIVYIVALIVQCCVVNGFKIETETTTLLIVDSLVLLLILICYWG